MLNIKTGREQYRTKNTKNDFTLMQALNLNQSIYYITI